jgi:hypothetical protein
VHSFFSLTKDRIGLPHRAMEDDIHDSYLIPKGQRTSLHVVIQHWISLSLPGALVLPNIW